MIRDVGCSTEGADALTGRSVVVLRAASQAGPLVEELVARGAAVELVPLIGIEFEQFRPGLRQALARGPRPDWLVCTSANGVRAVDAALDGPPDPRTRLAVVGRATAAAARDLGWSVAFRPRRATAADLAAELPPAGDGRVLAALAELAGDDLEEGLSRRGFVVERVVAYGIEAVAATDSARVAVAGADAVLFTSPSLVDRFRAEGLCLASRGLAASIGPRTTARLVERGFELDRVVEADVHDGRGLVDALARALGRS